MEIKSMPTAVAGRKFKFTVKGQSDDSITKTTIHIDGKEVFSRDCDDPPCHEMFVVPENARGKYMVISANTSVGENAEIVVDVIERDTDSDTGAMMT